jgi:hypothetical protein
VTPLVLIALTALTWPFLDALLAIATSNRERVTSTRPDSARRSGYWVIFIAGLTLVFSTLSFIWIWLLQDILLYWELFNGPKIQLGLTALLTFSITSTIVLILTRLNKPYLTKFKCLRQAHYIQLLIASFIFLIASMFFWVDVTPYTFSKAFTWKRVDHMFIDGNTYNLMSIRNSLEQNSRLDLLKCDSQSILCRRMVSSATDWCVTWVDGKLIYDPSANELSAEVISCITYTGFTYQIEDSKAASQD